MSPVPFVGVVLQVSDIDGVVVGVVGIVGYETWRGNWGLVFFIGFVIVDFQIHDIIFLVHGQQPMG